MRTTAEDNFSLRCKICEHQRVHLYCHKQTATYYACKDCGVIFQFPRPSEEAMIDYVNAEYQNGNYGEYVTAQDMKFEHFRWRMERMRPYLKGGRLLDVGCSCGYFLQVAASEGYDVEGLEFSPSAIVAANPVIRPRIRQKSVDDLVRGDPGRYDVVTAFDLIEHLDQPKDFLKTVCRLLSSEGRLALSTPNARHFLRFLMGSRWPMLQPMQHLTIFSQKALHRALEETGFEIILSESTHKIVSFTYLLNQIRELNPVLSNTLQSVGRLIPQTTMDKYRHVNIGELLVIAKKRR
jgi:2-polyprenyl-3-methyl-5-hydroxy-6-metoxy-1,4-benzoquinol methylase